MSTTDKISIAITRQQHDLVKSAVERGGYASTSEVIREALRDWELKQRLRASQFEEIGRLWDEGLASGPSVELDMKAIIAEAKARSALAKAAE
ncbi:MAG: type II toxin-antitoxin system ParD family antitoxin [Hyphomicrobiaceae bacterium]